MRPVEGAEALSPAAQPAAQAIRETTAAKVKDSTITAIESDTIRLESVGAPCPPAGSIPPASATLPSVSGRNGNLMSCCGLKCVIISRLTFRL